MTAMSETAGPGAGKVRHRPLEGRRVLVTRAADQAAEMVALLEAEGATTILAPMIRIAPPEDTGPLDAACRRVSRFDWIVFSSVNAVEAVVGRLGALSLGIGALRGVRLCAVGAATAARLSSHGLRVDVVPPEYRAEALANAIGRASGLRGASILIPKSEIGREAAARELKGRGAEVIEVVAYRTVGVDRWSGGPDPGKLLRSRHLDVVTFTSPSAVDNFVRLLGEDQASTLLGRAVVACIGPVTADAAARHGVRTDVIPAEYTVPALVSALAAHFADRGRRS